MDGLTRWHAVGVAIVAVLGGSVSSAVAETPVEEGERVEEAELSKERKAEFARLVGKGRDAYNAGEYEEAIPYFEAAYAIVPHPNLQYRIALSHERAGEPEDAVAHYRKFLEQKPETSKRGAVEKRIARLEERASTEQSEAGDGERTEEESTPTVSESAAETVDTDAASGSPAPAGASNTLPIVAAVVGGTGLLAGGTLYGVGTHCDNNRQSCRLGLYKTAAVGSYIGAGVGLVGLGTAAALVIPRAAGSAQTSDGDPGRRQLDLYVTGRGLMVSGRF